MGPGDPVLKVDPLPSHHPLTTLTALTTLRDELARALDRAIDGDAQAWLGLGLGWG